MFSLFPEVCPEIPAEAQTHPQYSIAASQDALARRHLEHAPCRGRDRATRLWSVGAAARGAPKQGEQISVDILEGLTEGTRDCWEGLDVQNLN